ncbi:MAG: HAD-IA family hydrolase [Rhodomicrobiaceae bacterium]
MLEALLFDVDGTLAETEEVHRAAFNEAFAQADLNWHWDQKLYHELLSVTGGKERILYHVQRAGLETAFFTQNYIAKLHAQKTEHYVAMMDEGKIELRPGIRRLLEDARQAGIRLAITTTTSHVNVERLLKATIGPHALEWFEVYATGDRVPRKKPDPAIYQLALDELNLPASSCLAIEDAAQGLASSLGAGVATIITESSYSAGQNFDGALKIYAETDERPTLADLQGLFEKV